jgi:hypothetical protein
MESLTLKEKFDLWCVKNSFHLTSLCSPRKTDVCGLYDCGVYYLVAIVLKNTLNSGCVNLTRHKRTFLKKMSRRLQVKDFPLRYLLQCIMDASLYLEKWKRWVAVFMYEYEKTFDFILDSEHQQAHLVLLHRRSLLDIIRCVDETEEYEDIKSATSAFKIGEMLEASINASKILDSACYKTSPPETTELPSGMWDRNTVIDFSQGSLSEPNSSPVQENSSPA